MEGNLGVLPVGPAHNLLGKLVAQFSLLCLGGGLRTRSLLNARDGVLDTLVHERGLELDLTCVAHAHEWLDSHFKEELARGALVRLAVAVAEAVCCLVVTRVAEVDGVEVVSDSGLRRRSLRGEEGANHLVARPEGLVVGDVEPDAADQLVEQLRVAHVLEEVRSLRLESRLGVGERSRGALGVLLAEDSLHTLDVE